MWVEEDAFKDLIFKNTHFASLYIFIFSYKYSHTAYQDLRPATKGIPTPIYSKPQDAIAEGSYTFLKSKK